MVRLRDKSLPAKKSRSPRAPISAASIVPASIAAPSSPSVAPAPQSISKTSLSEDKRALLLNKDWRLEHFYAITNIDKKLIWFKMNEMQRDFHQKKANRNIILKSRRLGFTTFEALDMLDDVLFTKNFDSLLISYDQESAYDIFDNKVMLAWKNFDLRNFYELDTERQNKFRVGFKENKDGTSRSFSSLSVKATGRSGTFQRIHISEFAKICRKFPDKAREIITGTFPSVPNHGRIDIESTAEGEDSIFADMFWEAHNRPADQPLKPTEFKAFFYNWQWDGREISKISRPDSQIPKEFVEYQRKHNEKAAKQPSLYRPITDIQLTYWFYKWILQGKDWNKLFQEFPTTPDEAFRASGEKLFDQQIVEKLLLQTKEPRNQGGWLIYAEPQPGHAYALGVDPAEGVGEDSSAVTLIDFTLKTPQVVATYANNKIDPDILAYEIRFIGLMYHYPLVAVERNNTGFATLTRLRDLYPEDQIFKEVREGYEEEKDTHRFGWHTNLSTKPRMFYDLKTATNDDALDIPSKQIIQEMRTYDRQNLSALRASEGQTKHWDLLTALAIAYQMRTYLMENQDAINVVSVHVSQSNNKFSAI